MSLRSEGLPHEYARIERAQAHRKRLVFDCGVWLAETDLYPTAEAPCSGQVRVEDERTIDEGGTIIKVADHIAKDKPAVGERDRVIPSQIDRPSSQPGGFVDLLGTLHYPAVRLSVYEAV